MRKSLLVTLLVGTCVHAQVSFAADEATTMGVESRQGIFEVIRMYFGPMLGMVKGEIPFDADVVAHNAGKISNLATMIPDGFANNTQGADVDTEALDAIWDNIDDFNGKAATMSEKASALAAASADGIDATRKAFGAMGQACKACHDEYREQH